MRAVLSDGDSRGGAGTVTDAPTAPSDLERLKPWERHDRRVLAGTVRLPAAAAEHLADLLGMPLPDVEAALQRLARRGWAREEMVSTEREDVVRVWLPSQGVLAAYEAAGVQVDALPLATQRLQALLWDGTGTLAAARIISRLARGARERGLTVAEACRLRQGIEGAAFAGAQGIVVLVGEDWCTPIFVLVDRQERLPRQRQALARAWTRLLSEMPVMAGAMLLLVTPSYEEMDQWDMYLSTSWGRRGVPLPPVYMATAGALSRPWEALWTRVEGRGTARLYATLHRLGQAPLSLPLPFRQARAPALPPWTPPGSGERPPAMPPGAGRRRVLAVLLRHPGSTTAEVAALAGTTPEETGRVLEAMDREGLARGVEGRWTATSQGERLGRRLLGVPIGAKRVFPAPSFLPHQLELRAFLARLAREVRAAGGRVAALREAPLTAREFAEDGRVRRLVPDASAAVVIGGRMVHLLVEWDRGTTGDGRWRQKLRGYVGYYRHLLRYGRPLYWPLLLVVAPDGTREEAIARAATEVMPGGMLAAVRTTNMLALESRGPLGQVWREVGGERRWGLFAGLWPHEEAGDG